MVRINIIDVKLLSDQHLRAEWTEIQMLLKSLYNKLQKKSIDEICSTIPESYRLGTGHMKFFENKLTYLFIRMSAVHNELARRKFAVDSNLYYNYYTMFTPYKNTKLFGTWFPDTNDYKIIIERISSRLQNPLRMKKEDITYYRNPVNTNDLIVLMNESIA